MRIRPLLSSRLYAVRRCASVATGALGPLAPSLRRNNSFWPFEELNTAWICDGVMVMAADGWWQVTQRRPLAPRFWKNGLFSSGVAPLTLAIRVLPVAFAN